MTHAERMKEIRARVAKTSVAPWSVQVNHAYHISYILRSSAGNKIAQFFNWQDIGFDVNSESNSNFIAHARADIPYLLARVETLEAALGEAVQEMSENAPAIFVDKPLPKIWQDIARLAAIKEGRDE